MTLSVLDTVVLERDHPELGLRKGDLGAIVEVYSPDEVEVEFVTAGGRTRAVATLPSEEVRHVGSGDVLAVRPLGRTA
jgi:hypothetical protein